MQLTLGRKIRALRRRDGRTQEALAEALGVTPQAVSRWEAGGSYPEMGLLPAIANYFGVTIDELFGYSDERSKKVDLLVARIDAMKLENRGVDVNLDECIALARAGLEEFPGNDKLTLCLASVLYKAGGVRYGEQHLTDPEGYSVYDVQRHRGYAEWREAIPLYERALQTLEDGELRRRAVDELSQLYVNTGESARALTLAEAAPGLWGSREFLRIYACDGKEQARAYGEALLAATRACAALMVAGAMACGRNLSAGERTRCIRDAIGLFDHVCSDGNCGGHHVYIARLYLLLSLCLWVEGERDGAFGALDGALEHARRFDALCEVGAGTYTAPLLRLVAVDLAVEGVTDAAAGLPGEWPWWDVPEAEQVRAEMQADSRWAVWVQRCQPRADL